MATLSFVPSSAIGSNWFFMSNAYDGNPSTPANVNVKSDTYLNSIASFTFNLSSLYSQNPTIQSAIIKINSRVKDTGSNWIGAINSNQVFNQPLTTTDTTYSLNITSAIAQNFTLNLTPYTTKSGLGTTFYLNEISLEVTYTTITTGINKVYLGAANIQGIFIGGTESKKIYVGDILVYEKV